LIRFQSQKTMSSIELLDITEIAALLRTTVPTIRLRLTNSRKGQSDFPKPISGRKQRCLWLKSDVERYLYQCSERNNPRPLKSQRQSRQVQHSDSTLAVLKQFGLDIEDGKIPEVGKRVLAKVNALKEAGVNPDKDE
jgi:predicted DNA-binding transcriptional regulator AlpA